MSGDAPLPRVLFVTPAAFNRTTGGGITFGNLFAGWPKDRLATAHNDPVPTTTETCERYYRLGPAEIRRWGPLERIAPAVGAAQGEGGGEAAAAKPAPLRLAKSALFGAQLPDAGRLSPQLERWIAEFKPDLLYSILGTNAMMDLVLAAQRRFRLPAAVHIMDDWPATSYAGGLLGAFARRRMRALLGEVMLGARLRMGICDAMCAAYAERYGAAFEPFQNAVDCARWGSLARQDAGVAADAEVVYAGSVLPFAQLQSLIECCQAIALLGRQGMRVRLSIYSPAMYTAPYRERLALAPNVVLHDAITDDETFFRRMAGADVLLLPVNFDADTVRYIRYSMPTKVPAYLVSGTPILAYGPAEVAQVRYAKEAGWGHTVTRQGVDEVAAGLRQLLSDPALRARLSENARRTALQRHDAQRVRAAFQQALAQAALPKAAATLR